VLSIPRYGEASLAELLPSILGGMGVADADGRLRLEPAQRVCLLLVDGLGRELLERHAEEAPFMAGLLPGAKTLDAPFPASTAVSICTLSTGRPPGIHGITGYTMSVPGVDGLLQCLSWIDYLTGADLTDRARPESIQRQEPLLVSAAEEGIATAVVSRFDYGGSGLTRTAFHQTRFIGLRDVADAEERIAAISAVLRTTERGLVYSYDARLDAAAHVHGVASTQWRSALRLIDRLVAALVRSLPKGTRLYVTGDHGAIDLLPGAAGRVDIAGDVRLRIGVRVLAGEPRARHVHAERGQAEAVVERWREALGHDFLVLARNEAIEAGAFGPTVAPAIRPRIGDVVVIARDRKGVFDSRLAPAELTLVALHGALDPAETAVPLLEAECEGPVG
jgi:hypothetical protein